MASTIKIKRSTTAASKPTGLAAGELAINLKDQILFAGNGTATLEISRGTALANTNAYIDAQANRITLVNTNLTGTNTALRTLISDRLQVANAATIYQTKTVERAALANTNASIATQAGRITLVNTNLTGTNTALRALISDRYQVANVNTLLAAKATWAGLTATNTALRTLISDRLQVANAAATYETKASANQRLANTNSYIATRASWSALTGTNTALRTLISDRLQVANANARFATKAYAASNAYVNGTFLKITGPQTSSQTVNTNIEFAANVHIEGKLTVTGGITTYSANNLSVGDNMIYLNANSVSSNPDLGFAGNYNDGVYRHAGFFRDASDNGTFKVFHKYTLEPDASQYIDTSHGSFQLAPFAALNITVANNIVVSGNTRVRGLVANGGLGTSGQFLRTNGTTAYWASVPSQTQYLQVTNANATFATKAYAAANAYVKSVLANTNAYIATRASWTALTNTNTALRTLISDRLQVANAAAIYQTKAVERAALANTNAYIAAQATRITLVNTNLTGTNTALRTLISDRLQVANAAATYATKAYAAANSYVKSILANTNSYIASRASWTALTGTNTALRTLISDRLQVANAAAVYVTKVNPTTSGILGHTGRATISTNLAVTGNTSIGGNLLVDGNLTVEGAVTYLSTSTLSVDDSMIKMAANNVADTIDTGFYSKYVSSGTKYSGLFRDATDGVFKFYAGLTVEPTSTVDTGGAGYGLATVDAIIDGGTY